MAPPLFLWIGNRKADKSKSENPETCYSISRKQGRKKRAVMTKKSG